MTLVHSEISFDLLGSLVGLSAQHHFFIGKGWNPDAYGMVFLSEFLGMRPSEWAGIILFAE